MTDDFDLAVEEGATIVRVGRAIFDGVPLDEASVLRGAAADLPTPDEPDPNEDSA